MKRTSLGKSFTAMHTILSYCESKCEQHFNHHGVIRIDPDKLGGIVDACVRNQSGSSEFVNELLIGWGTDAANFRSAFKYRGKESDLIHLAHENKQVKDLEFRLPFPRCVLVVDDCQKIAAGTASNLDAMDVEEMCLYMEERLIDGEEKGDWYENAGLKLGDPFICVSMGFLAKGMKDLQLVPLEFHFTTGRHLGDVLWTSAPPRDCPTYLLDHAKGYGQTIHLHMMFWMAALYAPQLKKDMRQGLKPGVLHMPRRKERVFYEHTMMQIDPTKVIELKDPIGSHAKHRLHPVRGFYRKTKTGKRVWVKPHWRGDKELGVVTHDYNLEPE